MNQIQAKKSSTLVHFSGGADSTLTAALYAERFDTVYLVTYDRFSFIGAKNYTLLNYERLCRRYGKNKFKRIISEVGKWHKKICYDNYFYFAKKYGLAVVALMFSKLAFHWRSVIFCIENNISTVGDGMVPYMDLYPDQNKKISLERLRDFYRKFDIQYENPIYEIAEEAEQFLYDKGVINTPSIRGTEKDKQVFYAEQVLFALFLKYYLTKYDKTKYEDILSNLFDEKITFMEKTIFDWLKNRNQSLIGHFLK